MVPMTDGKGGERHGARPSCSGPVDCWLAHDDGPGDDCQICPSYKGRRRL